VTKFPRTSTRMNRDSLALRRAVAALRSAVRVNDGSSASDGSVFDLACEVERIANCIAADARETLNAVASRDAERSAGC
jgi:hypothetical protein